MKKQNLLLALMLSVTASAFADEAEINGLWYELVSKTKEAKVIMYKNVQYSGNIVIPETVEYEGAYYSVTCIGGDTFRDCHSLTSVTFPNSVTSIGASAFYDCWSLIAITIPNSVTTIDKVTDRQNFYPFTSLVEYDREVSKYYVNKDATTDVAFTYYEYL